MNNKRKKFMIVILILLIILLGFKMCTRSNDSLSFTGLNSKMQIDKNMIDLKKLIYEDDLCDDEWARKILKLGKKIVKDANEDYLKNYYLNGNISDELTKEYENLGKLCISFAELFLDGKYKEASKVLKEIKVQYIKIGEYSNEDIY